MSTQVEGLGLALTMRSFAQQPRHRYGRHPHSRSSGSVKTVCRWVGATGPGIPASEGTSFICGQSTPDTVFLAGIHGPAQTVINDLTAMTDGPGFLCLDERRAGAPNGEEQFGVQTEAGSTITPRHQDHAPCIEMGCAHQGVNLGGALVCSRVVAQGQHFSQRQGHCQVNGGTMRAPLR